MSASQLKSLECAYADMSEEFPVVICFSREVNIYTELLLMARKALQNLPLLPFTPCNAVDLPMASGQDEAGGAAPTLVRLFATILVTLVQPNRSLGSPLCPT